MLVFLNRLVMKLVSFQMYVKVAHFFAGVCVCVFVNCFLLVLRGWLWSMLVDCEGIVV